jgi:TM2 domain-containing membrane protein YozV
MTTSYCRGCGNALHPEAAICRQCGVATQKFVTSAKSPAVALLLSFLFTGLGQLYNGEIGKAAVFLAVAFVNIALMFVMIGFFTGPITWIWSMVDAYKVAKKNNPLGT